MSGYGGYNAYPPPYGGQQLLSNYAAYNGTMGGYGNGYYPQGGYLNQYGGAYGGYNGGLGYGGYGGGYGSYGYGGVVPYKPSTLRSIYNRIRHGSAYGGYPYYGNGYLQPYEYSGRHHRGSWIDYQ